MLLNLVTYLVIPIITIALVHGHNWFSTNFSVIGNRVGRQELFVLWGLLVGIYFFWCLRTLTAMAVQQNPALRQNHRTHQKHFHVTLLTLCKGLVPAALVLLTCAITTPYLPELFPFQAFLHIVFAFLSAVCLVLALILLVWQLVRLNPLCYRRFLLGIISIIVISAVLFFAAGIISSALEIFFTLSTSVLVNRLHRLVSSFCGAAP